MQTKKARIQAPEHRYNRASWIEDEVAGSQFKDARLHARFRTLLHMMTDGIGESIPLACQDWANTKAAYRFFSNDRVSEEEILSGHFQSTGERLAKANQRILMLHDTSEFSFQRQKDTEVGSIGKFSVGKAKDGRQNLRTLRGILMHSSLAVTTDGLPLGLAAIKFWTRKQFKGCNALKRKINPTRVPIEQKESIRWLENLHQATGLMPRPEDCVHIGDRESDIYELFCTAQELKTYFLVRTCVDRLVQEGECTIADQMEKTPVAGVHRIEAKDKSGKDYKAVLEIKYRRMQVLPPIGKQKNYPALTLTIIHATERGTPRGRAKIQWKLATNLPVTSLAEVVEKLKWYAMRWKIETFHKILKSGCKAEQSKLRSSERLANLIALFCIIGWRVFWTSMMFRVDPDQCPEIAFTKTEMELLNRLIGIAPDDKSSQMCLGHYLLKVAQLGGYLARASDSPPGNMVMWRGMSRLTDIHLGFLLAKGDVGN